MQLGDHLRLSTPHVGGRGPCGPRGPKRKDDKYQAAQVMLNHSFYFRDGSKPRNIPRLLEAPGIATGSDRTLLGAPGHTTRNMNATS